MRLCLSILFALFAAAQAEDSPSRPNILFCMADDWGWPHAGAYGDEAIKTPTFDRLAKEGALFQHTYVSSPSCTPSRNAVITGKYHWQLGPGANLWSTLPVEHDSFIHLLADSGYVIGQNRAKTWGPGKIESWVKHHGQQPAGPTFKAIAEFLENTGAKEQPFCFWLATSDPHRPYKKGSGKAAGIDPAKVQSGQVTSDMASSKRIRSHGTTLALSSPGGRPRNVAGCLDASSHALTSRVCIIMPPKCRREWISRKPAST